MKTNMFSFDGISSQAWKNAAPSKAFMQQIKNLDKCEDNSHLDFSWINDFVKNH